METILLTGDSRANAKLLLELAKKLNFSAKIISSEDAEERHLLFNQGRVGIRIDGRRRKTYISFWS